MIKRGAFEYKTNGKTYQEEFTILGEPITVHRVSWTPVVFDDEKDPCFFRTKMIVKTWEMQGT